MYTKNPDNYVQIRPPSGAYHGPAVEARYQDVVVCNEQERAQKIKEHCKLVANFARFLSTLGLTVVFDQYVKDKHISNKPKWLQQNIANSDFVILVITPSFRQILREAPDEEIFFKGNYLENLINGLGKRDIRIVCVFLDRPTCLEHIPEPLRSGNAYELQTPFNLDSGRHIDDNLNPFVSLLMGE